MAKGRGCLQAVHGLAVAGLASITEEGQRSDTVRHAKLSNTKPETETDGAGAGDGDGEGDSQANDNASRGGAEKRDVWPFRNAPARQQPIRLALADCLRSSLYAYSVQHCTVQ